MSEKKIVVLISGVGSNFRALFAAIVRGECRAEIVGVISDRAHAQGLEYAQAAGLATCVVSPEEYDNRQQWNDALLDEVLALEPDLVVCAGFMRILGEDFVQEFKDRVINTHPALLPAFPGAHGVRDALEYGVRVTGVTVHFVDTGVDTGPIVAQQAVDVLPTDTVETLHERIKVHERTLLVQVVKRLCAEGWSITGREVTFGSRSSQ